MAHLIDKDALVTEITKRKDSLNCIEFNPKERVKYDVYRDLLSSINTLEVKEVDLKKEFSQWWKDERAKDYNVDILYERYYNVSMKLAKHFFELGMAVSNKV